MNAQRDWRLALLMLGILLIVAWSYWPLLDAGFVWVDNTIFHEAAWLRYGNGWIDRVFHQFYDWVNYFRPLTVFLWVVQARAFDVTPQAMHGVSLALHLANTLLVGLLGRLLWRASKGDSASAVMTGGAMLLYGLHPASIEPVAWISSQAEPLVTLLTLAALGANLILRNPGCRATAVATIFFLAACAKESAVALPLVIALIDIMLDRTSGDLGARLGAVWRRQWLTYVLMLVAGLAYLALRWWGLGFLLQATAPGQISLATRWQTASFVFVNYWRILLWPMFDLGPLHIVNERQFAVFSWKSLSTDCIAIVILAMGLYMAWRRKPLGFLVLTVCATLLPVMHVIPVTFDLSLYHERYALTAIAMASVLLPRCLAEVDFSRRRLQPWLVVATASGVFWLGLGIANIRATLPLWNDEIKLWNWVLQRYPSLQLAQSHLLAAYHSAGERAHAHNVADAILAEHANCVDCMLNVATLAVEEGDVPRLKTALENVRQALGAEPNKRAWQAYLIAVGQLHELQGETQEAVNAYQDAIRAEPLDPMARMDLALLLARHGDVPAARRHMEMALQLFAPDQRAHYGEIFERVAASAAAKPERH